MAAEATHDHLVPAFTRSAVDTHVGWYSTVCYGHFGLLRAVTLTYTTVYSDSTCKAYGTLRAVTCGTPARHATSTHDHKVSIQTHILSVSILCRLQHAAWTVLVLQTSHCSC